MDNKLLKIETFIPREYLNELRKELNDIGALTVGGNYDNCMTVSKVIGSWRPLFGSEPFDGEIGEISEAEEMKVEFCCKEELLKATVETIRRVHPYEIPVINIIHIINPFTI